MLGSHGLVSKMVFHEEAVHVPLIMRMPGAIRPGTVVKTLFATILDYLDVHAPARDGNSLRRLIEGRGKVCPDYRVAEWGTRNVPNNVVRTADWKLMNDLRNAPYEMRNLLGDPADRSRSTGRPREMKDRLVEWLRRVHSAAFEGMKGRKVA